MKISEIQMNSHFRNALISNGIKTLTPIQASCFHDILAGKDIIAISKTGSGKTLAYLLPLLLKKGGRTLILVPTRELAMQISDFSSIFLPTTLITGGIDAPKQIADIIVGTPGRILWYMERTDITDVDSIVLDEADKLLEKDFVESVKTILEYFPVRQTLLFSATIKNYDRIETAIIKNAVVHNSHESKNLVEEKYIEIDIQDKIPTLYKLLKESENAKLKKTIVFFSTCKEVKFHSLLLNKLKLRTHMLTGRMKQQQRIKAYQDFSRDKEGILICTDIGARGLNFSKIKRVIQYNPPDNNETYTHRIGRTARQNEKGEAIIFINQMEKKILENLKEENKALVPYEFTKTEGEKNLEDIRNTKDSEKIASLVEIPKNTSSLENTEVEANSEVNNKLENIKESKKKNQEIKNLENNQNEDINDEKGLNHKTILSKDRSLCKRIKFIIANGKDLKFFAERYIDTYHKSILLQKKKYQGDIEKNIENLKRSLGL